MDKYKIKKDYGTHNIHEISVDWNGFNFLIIYGKHKNNEWFIALPEWNICIRATEPTDIYYNIGRLSEKFNDHEKGKLVAEAIREHWESINRESEEQSNERDNKIIQRF